MTKKVGIIFIVAFISIILGTSLLSRAKKFTMPVAITATYANWSAKQDMVNRLTDGADTVILGDSTAYGGINPDELGPHVYNFALDANSPLEGFYFLKYMIAQNKRPKNVVLSYLSYSYHGGTYWDHILGFNLPFIPRKDAREILDVDQNTSKAIVPYGNNHLNNKQIKTAHIPYYFDIGAGPLNHVKPDFNAYIDTLSTYYRVFNNNYKSRGWGGAHIKSTDATTLHCTNKKLPATGKLTVPFYLKKLVDLANLHNINVYLLGGPIAESCVNLGYSLTTEIASGIDISKLKLSGVRPKTPIPDKWMINSTHANRSGSSYFTQKIKPFFDEIE